MTHLASGRLAIGTRGAVAAGHPLAASAGLRLLEQGGTAIDACLAMAAVAWVVMPDMAGPGGDLFALWREPDGTVRAVTGAGPAPQRNFPASDPEDRAALALVPGAPAAVAALRQAACRRQLADIFAPAIAAAEYGFVVGARLDRQLQALPRGRFRDELAASWGGTLPRPGGIARPAALARALKRWAEQGDAALVQALPEWAERGARVAESDVAAYRCAVEAPLSIKLGAWTVHGQPPMSQAVASLAALGTAGMDVIRHPDDAYRDHLLIESYKRAFGGLQALGESGDVAQSVRALLDPAGWRAAREAIGPKAASGPAMTRNYGETTQCAAVDGEGRVASVIHSLYRPFGARVLSPTTGYIANDRGASFSDGANIAAPGRRPRHTLVNLLADHADGAAYALGTPGAQAQTQTTLQVLSRILRDRAAPEDLWAAIAAPRWSFIGDRRIAAEASLPATLLDGLTAYGHEIALRPPVDWLMGSVSLAAWHGAMPIAVADPRREALALAL
jgi:gamma-glutamyltranspeptidase/glutathione hydrolase